MRLNIKRSLRIILLLLSSTLLIFICILLYREYSKTDYSEEKVILYEYKTKSNINYDVNLKPNNLYDKDSIGPGNIYIDEYIENITATYSYEYSGDKYANYKGNYDIVAQVQGYTVQGEDYKAIWSKNFILTPKTDINVSNKSKISLLEEIKLDMNQYKEFVKNIFEEAKLNTNVKLMVIMNINLTAETDKGVVEEKLSPTLTIPLNTSYFEITQKGTGERPGSIEETRQVPIPINKSKIILYCCVIGLLIIGLIFLLFFTRGVNNVDKFEKELKKIFKNHGNRLVALNNEIVATCDNLNKVKSIDDLVRIADEIGKPIMYQYSPYKKDMNEFYVIDDHELYVFDINKKLEEFSYKSYSSNEESEQM